jgi:hypothetical protein
MFQGGVIVVDHLVAVVDDLVIVVDHFVVVVDDDDPREDNRFKAGMPAREREHSRRSSTPSVICAAWPTSSSGKNADSCGRCWERG